MSCRPEQTSILKVSSRREAAKLVTDAAELLEQEPAVCRGGASIAINPMRDSQGHT